MASQSGDECLRLPVAEGSVSRKAAAFGRPSGALCQASIRGRLIDKDETGQRFVEDSIAVLTNLRENRPIKKHGFWINKAMKFSEVDSFCSIRKSVDQKTCQLFFIARTGLSSGEIRK